MTITFNPNGAGGVGSLPPTGDVGDVQNLNGVKGPQAYQQIDASGEWIKNDPEAGRLRGLPPPPPDTANVRSSASMALSQLNEQAISTDIYAVMALFQKCAQEQRDAARQVRDASLAAQVQTLKNAAQEIRNAAQERMVGAIVQASFQIAGGLMQMGAGVASGIQGMKAANMQMKGAEAGKVSAMLKDASTEDGVSTRQQGVLLNEADKFAADAKMFEAKAAAPSNRSQVLNAAGMASGQIMGGIGSIVNATQERKAAEHDAKRSELEAQAKVQEAGYQQANELMQQMMDVIRDIRDKLSSIDQSRMETNRGIARNI
ncbi:type III secretion system translocon subunit SctB [Bordetella genomosp. 13]|uniref:Uncharacterized protein n=1 Tax=Bordetella genomosp. 13 TaxID=463040 RepID=A0A1W6Z8I4_9BORD|nr:type III secretion system translocon subunit SctB [Bordetella genomosp. 13]ARP93562.1 hypothetical protein CAL15_03690 [Bordetella genomosp. 13]